MKRLLIVEDDDTLRDTMADYLKLIGYQVVPVATAAGFSTAFQRQPVDLVLLDLNLPDDDGLHLLAKLRRQKSTPVFVVSGRCDQDSRLRALETQADDYIVKPFNIRELGLRIQNFFTRQETRETTVGTVWEFGEWRLESTGFLLQNSKGEQTTLTQTETLLLCCLLQAEGQVVSPAHLLNSMASQRAVISPESLPVIISRLRRKLQTDHDEPLIVNIQGAGYRLTVPVKKRC